MTDHITADDIYLLATYFPTSGHSNELTVGDCNDAALAVNKLLHRIYPGHPVTATFTEQSWNLANELKQFTSGSPIILTPSEPKKLTNRDFMQLIAGNEPNHFSYISQKNVIAAVVAYKGLGMNDLYNQEGLDNDIMFHANQLMMEVREAVLANHEHSHFPELLTRETTEPPIQYQDISTACGLMNLQAPPSRISTAPTPVTKR